MRFGETDSTENRSFLRERFLAFKSVLENKSDKPRGYGGSAPDEAHMAARPRAGFARKRAARSRLFPMKQRIQKPP